jgi:putative spermidine/putrescine transport system ATP-binding protein
MGTIKLTNINKAYGQTRACANIDLHIKEGEFFTLLGPSGCG